jgi:hypothetical protein
MDSDAAVGCPRNGDVSIMLEDPVPARPSASSSHALEAGGYYTPYICAASENVRARKKTGRVGKNICSACVGKTTAASLRRDQKKN